MKTHARALMASMVAAAALLGVAQAQPVAGDWTMYGHDAGGMRFSPLTQITPSNVATLKEAWVYRMKPAGEAPRPQGGGFGMRGPRGYVQAEVTPLVVDGIMYVTTPYRRIVALDAMTGKEIWVREDQGPARGVAYWPGDRRNPPRIVYTSGTALVQLDAKTGAPVKNFGVDGVLAPKTAAGGGASSPPALYKNVVISGTANPNEDGRDGDIRAFDLITGKQLWRFATIPEKGTFGYDTWQTPGSAERQTSVHVWGGITVDDKRGIAYAPLNDADWNRYGGDRHGDNLFSASVVALDIKTGKRLWHFQVTRHDIWDLDGAPPPTLFDVKQNGRIIPAVAVTSKAGVLFLLDRVTGEPIYGVEERPVAQSDVPFEKTAPTQPFPLKPPPIVRLSMTMDDIAKVTPEHEAFCRDLVIKNNVGLGGPYNPPGYNRSTLNFPGANGAINYGGFAFDPTLGYLIVNSQDLGQMTGLGAKGGARSAMGMAGGGPGTNPDVPYDQVGMLGRFKDPKTNMMCQKPPWGSLTAVNVNTGDIAWTVPLGVTDTLPPGLQNTGRPNGGGAITTASGLIFVGATDDSRFRAFETKTGKELWTIKLAAPSHSVPMTFMGKNGKQFLVFPSTGGSFLEDPATDDALTAYALP